MKRSGSKKRVFSEIPIIGTKASRRSAFFKHLLTCKNTAIFLGILGLIGALFSGLVTNLVLRRPKKAIVPLVSVLELTKPTSPSPRVSDHVYATPPVLEVTATSSATLDPNAIAVRLGKPRLHKEEPLPDVPRENFTIRWSHPGRRLVVILNTGPIIHSLYPLTPHGLYRVEFLLADETGQTTRSSITEFTYVYQPDFKELEGVLVPKDEGFASISGTLTGLEIRNSSTSGGYISADLVQEFDFKTNLCISGCFTMEFEDVSKPCGLDIALCDEWGIPRLSFVLPDGPLDVFAIKVGNEKPIWGKVRVRARNTKIGRTTEEEVVFNSFRISVSRQGGGTLCSLYTNPQTADFSPDYRAHERLLHGPVLEGRYMQVQLRVWKKGVIRLYGFTVAELARTSVGLRSGTYSPLIR